PISQSAIAYTPAATPGSPRSMRIRVGTDTPMRLAQTRCDSLRRTRAIARFSPRRRSAWVVAGGSAGRGARGITNTLSIGPHGSSICFTIPGCRPSGAGPSELDPAPVALRRGDAGLDERDAAHAVFDGREQDVGRN